MIDHNEGRLFSIYTPLDREDFLPVFKFKSAIGVGYQYIEVKIIFVR